MDEIDRAQTEIEHQLRGRLAATVTRDSVEATGACLNCGEPLPPGHRWCDAHCRDDWGRLARAAERPVP